MPYTIDGKKIARVTEIVGAGECQAIAAIEKYGPKDRPRSSHSVTLPGTLTHSKVEDYERQKMGLKSMGLHLDKTDNQLFAKIFGEHKKEKANNPGIITTYDTMIDKVKNCFGNFLAFEADHPHVPVFLEERKISPKYGYGGTVDMIAIVEEKGYMTKDSPNPSVIKEKAYFKRCDHATNCECKKFKNVIILLDWKTSSRKQDSHRIQLSAYFNMWEELGVFDKFRAKGYVICWETWSVLLGRHSYKKYKTPYQVHYYDPNIADFLERGGVHRDPRNVTINLKGNIGLKGRCMFCSDIINCPDRLVWTLRPKGASIEHPTMLTRTELAQIEYVFSHSGNGKFIEVHDKVKRLLDESRRVETEIEELIPEVLENFKSELQIKLKPAK